MLAEKRIHVIVSSSGQKGLIARWAFGALLATILPCMTCRLFLRFLRTSQIITTMSMHSNEGIIKFIDAPWNAIEEK